MQAQKIEQSPSAFPDLRGLLLVILVSGYLAGVLAGAWLFPPPVVPLLVSIPGLLLLGFCWHLPVPRLSGCVLLCLCLGVWRYGTVSPAGDARAIRTLLNAPALEIQGEVAAEPRLENNSTLLTVDVQSARLNRGQSWRSVHGQIQVQVLGATFDDPYAPHYGDTVQLTGRLTAPPEYATPELQGSMAFPRLSIVGHGGNPLLAFFYQVRTNLAALLQQALPEPYAALLIAIFLSLRTPALKSLITVFNVTGTAHLVAPSGFKVTLLAGVIAGGTRWLVPRRANQDWSALPAERRRGDWRRWLHTLLLVFCIAVYTVLSGAGPAAIRAGLMGMLLILAPRLKRRYNVYTAMALTALVMCLADPFILFDTGFQLSFIGTLGILLFTPFFQHLLRFFTRLPLGSHVVELVSVTLAAQVATLPIFALSFQQISFIAPLANLASVPLLGLLLTLGGLICLAGLLAPGLALFCGWLVWPWLWYITTAISWCARLPGAYLPVGNLSPPAAWTYYALLAWLTVFLLTRRHATRKSQPRHTPLLTRRVKHIFQGVLALLTLCSTGILVQTTARPASLTITLLSAGDPTQGQALLLRTPTGQTALINEDAGSSTLAQTLDTRLPFWQRSLDLVILSDTGTANLAGLQDIVARYQVRQVVDGGMLHPSLAYARWRGVLAARGLSYTQVRQGALITLSPRISFEVLWPPARLHKSGDESQDNALVLRLRAPGLNLLLLNSTALSNYALQTLPASLAPSSVHADIVQLCVQSGKAFPSALAPLLTQVRPSLLVLTNTPARSRKNSAPVATPAPDSGSWQVLHGEQAGPLDLQSDDSGWKIHLSG